MLADKTFPQIRAIDRAYQEKYDKTLVQLVNSEKTLRGNSGSTCACLDLHRADFSPAVEYALKGLVMGPLYFDVYLLGKALDGAVRNDVSRSVGLRDRCSPSAPNRPSSSTCSSADLPRRSPFSALPIVIARRPAPLPPLPPSRRVSKQPSCRPTAPMQSLRRPGRLHCRASGRTRAMLAKEREVERVVGLRSRGRSCSRRMWTSSKWR